MAIWRSPELEVVFGGALDGEGITEASVHRLIAEGASESEQLDFKKALWVKTSGTSGQSTQEQEFAKDVAMFANHRGGVLLVGMDEQAGIATATTPIPPTVIPEKATGKALRYPIRHGTDARWLTEHEVAERYRLRANAQEDERARIESVIDVGSRALWRADGAWLYFAVIPEAPANGRLDAQAVRDIERWHRGDSLNSPLRRSLPAHGQGIPGPGTVTFTASLFSSLDDATNIHEVYVEFHIDGSAFAARSIDHATTGDSADRQLGAWGSATVVIGLVDADSGDGALAEPIGLVAKRHDDVQRIPATRCLTGRPCTDTVADLAAVGTVQQRLSVTYLGLSGLPQWFGIAECRHIRPDGSLDDIQFTNPPDAEAWATQHGIVAAATTPA